MGSCFSSKKKITIFTVYFLINTNNAVISEGYNSENKNAFIYLIETGSLWKSPIEKGDFYTQLKGDISLENLKASSPNQLYYNKENNILKFSLVDYGINPDRNFVITYSKKITDFNFEKVTTQSNLYFNEIDSFSNLDFKTFSFEKATIPNAYHVDGVGNTIVNSIFYFSIYAVPILIVVVMLLIFLLLYKKFKKH